MVPVLWYLGAAQWDTALPYYILGHAAECEHYLAKRLQVAGDIGVIVIPGRHSAGENHYTELNEIAAPYRKVIFIIIGDEEADFRADKLQHQNKKVWWLMPPFNPKQKVDRVGPNGWPTHAIEMIAAAKEHSHGSRPYDWSFMGQMTHSRRVECVGAASGLPNGKLLPTKGFTQGVPREDYYASMVRSKVVFCPSGPCTPDSFRFCEALEAGAIPIADDLTPKESYPQGYWNYVFGTDKLPFPVVSDWSTLPSVLADCLKDWQRKTCECQTWWMATKHKLVNQMKQDLTL